MASIMGVEIKKSKTYRGHEDEPCLQGELHIDGKKVGSFFEETWSGDYETNFINKEAEALFNARQDLYYKKNTKDKAIACATCFIYDIRILTDKEKDFKKHVNKETKKATIANRKIWPWMFVEIFPKGKAKKDLAYFVPDDESLEKLLAEHRTATYKVYRDLADFIIS